MDRYTMHIAYNGCSFSTQAIQNLDPDTAKDVSTQAEWVKYTDHKLRIEAQSEIIKNAEREAEEFREKCVELERENAELKKYISLLEQKGSRMAMALTDAQCGFVCEHRFEWDELLEEE